MEDYYILKQNKEIEKIRQLTLIKGILSGSDQYSRLTGSFTKRIRANTKKKEKKGGNRRMVELNAREEKRINAIHRVNIPPLSLVRIRNRLTVRLFQRGVARTREKTRKSGTIQKRDKMINRRG